MSQAKIRVQFGQGLANKQEETQISGRPAVISRDINGHPSKFYKKKLNFTKTWYFLSTVKS